MTFNDFELIYKEMLRLHQEDKELTNIIVNFQIKPVVNIQKIASINVKTFKIKKYGK
jgi:hypothetical protein